MRQNRCIKMRSRSLFCAHGWIYLRLSPIEIAYRLVSSLTEARDRRHTMRGHVLIVDDNPIDLKLAAELLEAKGFKADAAVDAEQAQDVLTQVVPDLILTDIALPGMDGLTLTRVVKADPRLQHVPVVALTAFAKHGDDERAAAAGCDGYLTKPLNARQFADQIAAILRASVARRNEARQNAAGRADSR
jgi:two-component system, cell cycle response regulator DivK